MPSAPPIPKVFVSYSRKDLDLLEEFTTHTATLKRAAVIESWTDRDIPWGAEWEKKLWEEFHAADIIVLLVSEHFLASKYAYDKEFGAARKRHERGEVRILPVIVTECDWQDGHIDKFEVVQFEKAASVWGHGDHPRHRAPAWTAVAKQLPQVAEEMKAQTKVLPEIIVELIAPNGVAYPNTAIPGDMTARAAVTEMVALWGLDLYQVEYFLFWVEGDKPLDGQIRLADSGVANGHKLKLVSSKLMTPNRRLR